MVKLIALDGGQGQLQIKVVQYNIIAVITTLHLHYNAMLTSIVINCYGFSVINCVCFRKTELIEKLL